MIAQQVILIGNGEGMSVCVRPLWSLLPREKGDVAFIYFSLMVLRLGCSLFRCSTMLS